MELTRWPPPRDNLKKMKVLESDLDPNPSPDPHCLCDPGPSYLAPCILSAIALGKVRLMIARAL